MPPSMNSPSAPSLVPAGDNGTLTSSTNESRHATQKRNRAQLSCTNCRHAKLKCDRKEPCSQCVKKGRESQCIFPRPAPRRKPAVSMQNRLKHLESLVKGAMSGQSPMESRSHGDESSPSINFQMDEQSRNASTTGFGAPEASSGKVLVDENETTYVGATHWAAILEDIEEVKSYFYEEVDDDNHEEDGMWPTAALSFDIETPATKFDLLAALPPRLAVDQLVSRYFNSNSPTLHIFHSPTFQKEYQHFWSNQNDTPIAWLALLYSILVIATLVALGAGEESPDNRGSPSEMIRSYRQCSIQALVLSHYTKPGPYTLETFMIYMEGEFLLNKVDQVQCYLLVGNAVRLGLRMGLHRDSSKIGGHITPFQGEMRRRMWHHMKQIDLLASFHIGLPSTMQSIDSDTLYPGNFRDDDIAENMTELPGPRPDSEHTPISYMVTKSRICDISCKIATIANLLTLPPYSEVMKLDSELMDAHARVPHFFQLPSSGIPITDKPERIVRRISIELLFQKSRCMLHRKYLIKEKKDSRFAYSKDAGLDSSLQLLRIQALAHEVCLPGGLLARDRWFQSALSMHDFLLAAMIVYLSVIRNIGTDRDPTKKNGITQEQQNTIAALEESYRIWTQSTNPTADGKRAAAVLKIMLKKVNLAILRNSSDPSTIAEDTMDRCESYTSNLLSSNLLTNLSLNGDSSISGSSSALPPSDILPIAAASDTSPSSGRELPLDIDLSFLPMESWGEAAAVPSDFSWVCFPSPPGCHC
ncbi:uncharacterized protein LY89DRAFT_702815 [Mollisia scopiformis]|uniref:Zn(2)-C6 fungal-type domain-containing protein n=1 Tax=Mollisia scopiformis TaxID=149040 RepID=A0A132B2R4_MOLSC|nr:uncharacterized protein LY89DRAFT_702815 [Mollisia scopiformis]KUJ06682.1 hypothetical protein LY89DRAFT_702815 [Mollisia scopiformis]